jgi:hypothetical protein
VDNSEDANNNVAEMAMSIKVWCSIRIFIWHDNFSYSVITSFLYQTSSLSSIYNYLTWLQTGYSTEKSKEFWEAQFWRKYKCRDIHYGVVRTTIKKEI